jgi:hypothetical protein
MVRSADLAGTFRGDADTPLAAIHQDVSLLAVRGCLWHVWP